MLKFKMSLLLKNAKFKAAIATVLLSAIVLGMVCVPKNNAADISEKVTIQANKTGVKIGKEEIYCIKKDPNDKAVGYDKIFCIEQGASLSYKTYNGPKKLSESSDYFSNYNSAMWLINNMYITNITGENGLDNETAKKIAITNFATMLTESSVREIVKAKIDFDFSGVTAQKIIDLKDKTINSSLNKSALEVIEQMVMWNYTKNVNTEATKPYEDPKAYFTGTNLSQDEQVTLKYVYYALRELANGAKTTNTITVKINTSSVKLDKDKKQMGPYYIEVNETKIKSYEIKDLLSSTAITITKKDGSVENAGVELLSKNNDGSFYINLSSFENIQKVSIKISNLLGNVTTTGYVLDGGKNQNLLTLQKSVGVKSVSDEKDVPAELKGNFNVELKKVREDGTTVITSSEAQFKVNGEEKTTSNGVLAIANNVKIENAEQTNSYEIVETKAPKGFVPFNGTLKLTLGFKLDGENFIIDESKVKSEGFKDKTRVEVSGDKTTVTVYVVNKEEEKKSFDLSLRKYISKINGENVEISREPVINEQSIKMLQKIGTASYYHTKNSLAVKIGDEVEYTIRVYNEGEILGFAKQVTDYLPVGLTFVKLSDDTAKEYTTDAKVGAREVVINYSGNKVIKTLRDFINKEVKVNNEYYQEMKMICKVQNTTDVYITNRAEITNYGYEEVLENGERVWKEAKSIGNVDRDSVQNTIKNELNLKNWYKNAKENTYVDENGKQVTDKNYYPGAQDDDDFETVELLKGKYNVVIKKVDASDNNSALEGAYFSVVKNDNDAFEVGPTKSNGKVDIIKEVDIFSNIQNDIYVIKETKAPEGYDLFGGNIKLDVKTKIDDRKFVIDEKNTTVTTDNNEKIDYIIDSENTTITIIVPDFKLEGKYNVVIKKVDASDKNNALEGAYFSVIKNGDKAFKVGPTDSDGKVDIIKGASIINNNQNDIYSINETKAPEGYNLFNGNIELNVKTKLNGKTFIIDEKNTTVKTNNNEKIDYTIDSENATITIIIPDTKKEFDLALRKFITEVNGKKVLESREPKVDVSKLASGESTTANYKHTKEPLDVNSKDIVTYTIRVYNEGEVDGYATKIMDDIPEGVEFVPATYDQNGKPTNTNAVYGWTLYRELKPGEFTVPENIIEYNDKTYIVTDNVKKAEVIVTDYLSKENGENNLLKAFDPISKKLDYKDVKVAFKVIEPNSSDRIIINYAQITEDSDNHGKPVKDRDSNPNKWIDGEDDQDIEKIKVREFDLELLKWVSKAIVYEDGKEKVTETKHTGFENPEPVVKVDLTNTSLDRVTVKFEYTIKVMNKSDVPGYAKEISDYIPQGLKFVKEDNPKWNEVDGKIVTRALENTLLHKDESAEVTVILTWINSPDNLGLKINTAEISEDYNEFGTPDKDSTPNNRVPDEDDIDTAPVILEIRTGETRVYVGLAIVVVGIVTAGVICIKKYVIK